MHFPLFYLTLFLLLVIVIAALTNAHISVPTVNKNEFLIHVFVTGNDAKEVAIYDQNGILVRDLFTVFGGGRFVLPWDRRDNNKRLVASGTYFVTIQGDGNRATVKIVVDRLIRNWRIF